MEYVHESEPIQNFKCFFVQNSKGECDRKYKHAPPGRKNSTKNGKTPKRRSLAVSAMVTKYFG